MNKRIAYFCIVVSILLLGAVNLNFLGAPRDQAAPTDKAKKLWTLAIPVKMATLDPQQVLSVPEKSLELLVFSRLVKMNDSLEIQPDVLESWSYDLTLNRYYFKIKPDIFFHDGRPLVADDVIFSIHQWAARESLDNDLLAPIKGAKAYSAGKAPTISGLARIDNYTFSIDLEEWVDHLIKNLSNPRFCIYPENFRGQTKAAYFAHPIGTGPYRIKSYTPEKLLYEANSRYHFGAPVTPQIAVNYMTLADASRAFNNRGIDDLIMYDVSDAKGFTGADVQSERLRSFSTFVLVFNGRTPVLQKKGARHSIASLIDKDRIIRNCYPGSTLARTLIPPGMVGSSVRESEDRDQVSKSDNLSDLTLYIPEDTNAECLKNILSENLQGTPVKVRVVSFRQMYELLKAGKLNMWVEDFEFKNEDPIGVLQYFSETSNEYLLQMKLPELQDMFHKLNKGLTSYDRARLYREIDDYMVRNHHILPIFYPSSYAIYRSSLKGIQNLRMWRYVADWQKVYAVE